MIFLVKGERGEENFEIQISDQNATDSLDSIRVGSIYRYLPQGITTDWQVVKIPLTDFLGADLKKIVSMSFAFTEPGQGTFWLDELCFSTEELVDRKKEISDSGYLLLDDFNHSNLNLFRT